VMRPRVRRHAATLTDLMPIPWWVCARPQTWRRTRVRQVRRALLLLLFGFGRHHRAAPTEMLLRLFVLAGDFLPGFRFQCSKRGAVHVLAELEYRCLIRARGILVRDRDHVLAPLREHGPRGQEDCSLPATRDALSVLDCLDRKS